MRLLAPPSGGVGRWPKDPSGCPLGPVRATKRKRGVAGPKASLSHLRLGAGVLFFADRGPNMIFHPPNSLGDPKPWLCSSFDAYFWS